MRKLLPMFLCAALCLALAACGGEGASDSGASGSSGVNSPSADSQSGINPAPALSGKELEDAVDDFLEQNEAFLSHSWSYLTADEIAGGALSRLNPDCLGDLIVSEALCIGHGYKEHGYVWDANEFSNDEERHAVFELYSQFPLYCGVSCQTLSLQSALTGFTGKTVLTSRHGRATAKTNV